MVINEVLSQLEKAANPVVKLLQNRPAGKVLVLGFKKGMILKEHQTAVPARLVIVEGIVNYKEEDVLVMLDKFSDFEIPVDVTHSVEALEDSICLLIVG
jgi:hypothetical protein